MHAYTGGERSPEEIGEEEKHLLEIFLKEQNKGLSNHEKINQDCYVSQLEGLTLQQYMNVLEFICKKRHGNVCKKGCKGMAEVARNILNDGFILLKDAFALSSPGITYTSLHARRKLLRMPLAAIGIGRMQDSTFHYYLVKKGTVRYDMFQCFANKLLQNCKAVGNSSFSKDDFKTLLQLAETDSERERLKFVAAKASGL